MERFSKTQVPRALWGVGLFCSTGLVFLLALRGNGGNAELPDPVLQKDARQLLDQIGKGQGGTQEATLEGPYEDPRQQAIPFGRRSFYLTPWRAYMDTWPARQYLDCVGINFNVEPQDVAATARILAEAGVRSARIELGWGALGYDEQLPTAQAERYRRTLKALQDVGIRPLVLLNSNSIRPVPGKTVTVILRQPAVTGSREIEVENPSLIRPGYTGFIGQRMGFPLVTAVDPQTGRCELSAPLRRDLPAGKLALMDMKYHPFSGTVLADGTPNPFAEETVHGWRTYVRSVCRTLKEMLGTEGKADAGFDLEVWNEYTFGSEFLDEKWYYSPPRKFQTGLIYENHGLTCTGPEIILPITVDYVNDPASRLPGVHVISGFSNQRPFDSGTSMWPGQTGFSRHLYANLNPMRPFKDNYGLLSPVTDNRPSNGPLTALGTVDGKADGKNPFSVTPGTFFVPTVSLSMPEAYHYGYQTEYFTRDIQPFPGPSADHYRYSNPGDGHAAQVWMTETNTGRLAWMNSLMNEYHIATDDPKLVALSHHVGAKALLRSLVFQSHKGVHTMEVFSAHGGDLSLGVVPDAFFKTLHEEGGQLTEKVRGEAGPQLQMLARINRLMKSGEPLEVIRPLKVSELVEHQPRLVFKGDGTPEHPDRFNRDDFACLPFQMTVDRYAIGYYVVTRNMVQSWNPKLDPLDPARYDMPEQTFDLTLQNLRGVDAKVSAWDPITDKTVPVTVLTSDLNTLKVQLPTVDYPRFLLIQESKPGPSIVAANLQREANGQARVSLRTNLPVTATLTWGPWPERNAGGHVDLPKGTSFDYHIPRLQRHEAVQVTVEQDGLTAPWPRLKHDTEGVLW